MRLLAPAKINLHLRVGPLDESGYHPLRSWMCTVGLFDTLTIRQVDTPSPPLATMAPPVVLKCDDSRLPADAGNLVLGAVAALRQRVPASEGVAHGRGLEITLEKRIPLGGGLGGGSSDAARILVALNRLWELGLSAQQLDALAATLGSDVPFFLHGPSSICSGRGEIVTPLEVPQARWALLILPGFAAPTADVYRKFDELRLGDVGKDAPPARQEWTALSAGPLLSQLRNDLEPAAFALLPQLGRLREALEQSLGRVIRMTGSGSTLFTLFDAAREAEVAAQFVRTRHMLEAIAVELAPQVKDDLPPV